MELRDGPLYHFQATLHRYRAEPSLLLSICNRNLNTGNPDDRHPDIFPAKLLARSVQYFEDAVLGGTSLRCLEGHWDSDPALADNRDTYLSYLAGLGVKRLTHDHKAAAAQRPWTRIQAKRLGFSVVDMVRHHRNGTIDAYYKRPIVE